MSGKIGAVLVVALLAGCAGLEGTSKETIGTGTGAVVGGVIGRSVGDDTAGMVVGGIVGAIAGGAIGRRMDARDREHAFAAFEENRAANWTNQETGARYSVRPTETFQRNGRLCREYTTNIEVGGSGEQASGVACQRSDGTWEIMP
jgi:surface antigen